jgi:PAS domain S-box-containing protein
MAVSRIDRASSYFVDFGVKPFAVAGFFVLVAFLWTLFLQHEFAYPFFFLFFGAVVGSAWFGGTVAGFLSVIFSALTVAYFFVPPYYSWSIDATASTYFIAFIVCALAVSWVSSARKRSEMAVRDARDHLEQKVQERTAELEQSYANVKESERQLRLLTEAIPQQIWTCGPGGQVEHCNQHLLAFVGRSQEEMRGEGYFSVIHPEDVELFRQSWDTAFRTGTKFEGEWRIRGADGRYRWFLIRGTPHESSESQIARWYGTHIEIEERHRAEQALVATQAELAYLSRTLSMGELAAGIMHEINQPLTAVVTHAYACREWLGSRPANLEKAASTAERIVQESTRASAVVARLRALFRKEPPAREQLDINRVIQNMARLLRDEAIRRDVRIHTELVTGLPQIEADRVQIEQVLLNLAINGMDAMAGTDSCRELSIASSRHSANEILVAVSDCGPGVSPEIATKIFEPFFSTKPNGIGVGLSISRSILEAHGGKLWTNPRQGGGAIFQFTIPIIHDAD